MEKTGRSALYTMSLQRSKLEIANESVLPMEAFAIIMCPQSLHDSVPKGALSSGENGNVYVFLQVRKENEKRRQYCVVNGICACQRMMGSFLMDAPLVKIM